LYNRLKNIHFKLQGLAQGFLKLFHDKFLESSSVKVRCLAAIVIIFVIFGILNLWDLSAKAKDGLIGGQSETEELITETYNDLEAGFLGGSFNLSAAAIPAAQASVDFSADDELENQDLAILEGSGLVAPAGPGADAFSGMRKEIITYTVASGDTPFDLAIKFGINTDTILMANNMRDGDVIRPGDKLIILPINGIRVKVGASDTVASLAKKYNGKVEEITAFNNIINGKLAVGDFLIIPDGEMPVAVKPKVSTPASASGKNIVTVSNWMIAPTTGRDWGRLHGRYGVDVANACGTPIYAAAAGTVTLVDGVGWNFGYGKYIMIKHPNGVVTLYAHTSQILVEQGQQVGQGQAIALMGTTGRSTGCHLHFEVRGAKNPLVGARTIR
jgi:murein DD-endopeptidase MepM/ murein hydrolase activator NlpD